jgi:hypothetical protein
MVFKAAPRVSGGIVCDEWIARSSLVLNGSPAIAGFGVDAAARAE